MIPIQHGTTEEHLRYIWFNSGEDKVARSELRELNSGPRTRNLVWDGRRVSLFGARNEVISAAIVIEAPHEELQGVTVSISPLKNLTTGSVLANRKVTNLDVFNFVGRPIELFYVRYLPIKGLSRNTFESYDERHIPERFRRPHWLWGRGWGTWKDRPDADKEYPDIAIPLELVRSFNVMKGTSQVVWCDFYLPKELSPGEYQGEIIVTAAGATARSFPVTIEVSRIILPDITTARTMVVANPTEINRRFFGRPDIAPDDPLTGARSVAIRQKYFQVARRHRLSLVDTNFGSHDDEPSKFEWPPRLDGSLYSTKFGYQGPGELQPSDVFPIGLYGEWDWKGKDKFKMWQRTDAWERWFQTNSPATERFLYLIDESDDFAQIEEWSSWIRSNPGVGKWLPSFATLPLIVADKRTPSLSIVASTLSTGDTELWQTAADRILSDRTKKFMMYNGHRPGSGTFVIEDDGVALRQLAWAQWKVKADRWFYWEATYYRSFQGRSREAVVDTNVFRSAHTFGGVATRDLVFGETGWNYSNGDGVLMYPGTDVLYPEDSYGVDGPFVSLRMKYWRRGIQDVEYLALASHKDSTRTTEVVSRMIPKVLWEYGVATSSDPTWQRTDISWSTNPDSWERARMELAEIITGKTVGKSH